MAVDPVPGKGPLATSIDPDNPLGRLASATFEPPTSDQVFTFRTSKSIDSPVSSMADNCLPGDTSTINDTVTIPNSTEGCSIWPSQPQYTWYPYYTSSSCNCDPNGKAYKIAVQLVINKIVKCKEVTDFINLVDKIKETL